MPLVSMRVSVVRVSGKGIIDSGLTVQWYGVFIVTSITRVAIVTIVSSSVLSRGQRLATLNVFRLSGSITSSSGASSNINRFVAVLVYVVA